MHDAATPRWMLPRGLKRQRLDQPPSNSSTENRIHEKRCAIRKRKPYTQSKIHPWKEQTGGLWEEEHNSPPRDGAQTVGQQTPEAPTADHPLDKPVHHLAQRQDKPQRRTKRARSTALTLPSLKKHRKSTDQLIAEAHSTHHSGEIWSPMVSHSTPVPPPTSSPPQRLPRAVKRLPSRLTIASIPGVSWIPNYPGKRPDQEVGRGPSTHLGAGMGIIALTPLTYGTHGTRWQDNIFCQYVGRVLPLSTAEREDYLSDYLLGWPLHGEAVDGQLDNQGSIGHLINDDFTRDGGSLEAHRDSRTGKSYLCITEDINPGDEPSFPYGIDFWTAHLMQLPSPSRKACIQKYRILPHTLTALGLDPDGLALADNKLSAPAPASSKALLRQTSLANWRIRPACTQPGSRQADRTPLAPTITCELSPNGTAATPVAAKESQSSEPALYQTGEQFLAPRDTGRLSVRVQPVQESPQAGDQLGMGDLVNEEALCRKDDSHPFGMRTHPMLVEPPPPLPASPPENFLTPDAQLPLTDPNPGPNQEALSQAAAQDPETLGL
eukprot:gene11699-13133_t